MAIAKRAPKVTRPTLTDNESAGLTARLRAAGLDLLLIVAPCAALAGVLGLMLRAAGIDLATPVARDSLAFATLVFPVMATTAYQEASPRQATVGKRRTGLLVVDDSGARLTFRRALGRSVVKFLPWQLGHTAVFHLADGSTAPGFLVLSIGSQLIVVISILAVALDTAHRAIHDWITHSRVVAGHARKEATT